MKIYNNINDLQFAILEYRAQAKSIGFVPTMGALHDGHISLLKKSVEENDISLVSIFVNPIQFNNPEDLKKYTRTPEDDSKLLQVNGCDIVFAPSVTEMYPDKVSEHYDFGFLENIMEGQHRPGHFNGVAVVVKRLLDICMPHKAYFGEKDFQQLMIIRALVEKEDIPVEIVACPIIREADGLAMSSRNVRLSLEERIIAPEIYRTLKWIRKQWDKEELDRVLFRAEEKLNALPGIEVEYIQIADERSLQEINSWNESKNARIFIALFLGEVRLIDNLKM